MRSKCPVLLVIGLGSLFTVLNLASATVHYVDANSASSTPPYTNWATAATVIQDAVDAAAAGDEIVVTNGNYATGGRAVGSNILANRVAVDKLLALRSVNGPEFTVIQGYQVLDTTVGDGAIRCVYLANGASLSGFTLTKGATRDANPNDTESSGAGVWCESTSAIVSNCIIGENASGYDGGGAYRGTLSHCTLTGNSALQGGGAARGNLNDCVLTGNRASEGGGAYFGVLSNCTLTANSAQWGAGAAESTLSSCTITHNSATEQGGGAEGGALNNCVLSDNSAAFDGGGANASRLTSCALSGNFAYSGGGASVSTLNNCTLTGNTAILGGGGASGCDLTNCVVYFNDAANYDSACTLSYSCATPLAPGPGNISTDPLLASASHLSVMSPCRGFGSAYASGTDIDGEAWSNPPSIGCDEYHAGAVTGPLAVQIAATCTNAAVGVPVRLTAMIAGRTSASLWEFGDGAEELNEPWTAHAWTAPGDYLVTLWCFNETYPEGVIASVTIRIVAQPVHYVAAGNARPQSPYTSWATAAANLQDAVDVAVPGALILVTNGIYASGGRVVCGAITNRVAVTRPLTLRSVNGPEFTVIQGYQIPGRTTGDGAVRCVYLANGASLAGFTLTRGATRNLSDSSVFEASGGGVWCESTNIMVSNCVISRNSASYGGGAYLGTLNYCVLDGNSASAGGGAFSVTLNHCTLTGNSAGDGGGASSSTLNQCVLSGNSANGGFGGGAAFCVLKSCSVTGNSAATAGGGASASTLNNCTVTANSASSGGGVAGYYYYDWDNLSWTYQNCLIRNSIVYFNTANQGQNYDTNCLLNFCGTTPLPPAGNGNIAGDPQLASPSHLSVLSPCRGSGSTAYASGTDIDDEPWANPPSIGCDEYHEGATTGSLSAAIETAFTTVSAGYPLALTASINGRTIWSAWEFGDGGVEINQPFTTHAWAAPGDYVVTLWCFNETYPDGVSATITIHVVIQPVHYVASGNTNPIPPYVSWATAATNVQDAAVAAVVPGALILVTNGTYNGGVAVNKPLSLRSVNGPQSTTIGGGQPCVHLAAGADLAGFTLSNGSRGVECADSRCVVSNCVISGNSVYGPGGGAVGGTLNNCALIGNTAMDCGGQGGDASGGGASGATLNNCIIAGNQAFDECGGESRGGGACYCTLQNCTLITNSLFGGSCRGGGAYDCVLNDCMAVSNSVYVHEQLGPANGGGVALCTLSNCTLIGNGAHDLQFSEFQYDVGEGGGAQGSTLNLCVLLNNSAAHGGGAADCTLNNCTLSGNWAYGGGSYGLSRGGGVQGGILNNCTLTGNSSADFGGGAAGATLNNCLLSGNVATNAGGGAYESTLNNCTIVNNATTPHYTGAGYGYGGGACLASLNNCVLSGNSATNGGGAAGCTLNNCTVTGNSALFGGGVSDYDYYYDYSYLTNQYCVLNNCILYFNTVSQGQNYDTNCLLNRCCTAPMPANGVGNITNAPLFVDYAVGNLRLQSNSPCINAGNNTYAPVGPDLDDNPRIAGGTVDIGAYEFQNPASAISFAWLQQYGLPTDGSADYADSDHDGMNNWLEWIAGTDPTDAASVLRLLPLAVTPPGLLLRWNSDTNHAYFVERSISMETPLTFSLLQTNLPGLFGTTTFIDPAAPAGGAAFYRIGTDSTIGSPSPWLQTPLFVPAAVTVTWTSVTNRSYFVQRSADVGAAPAFSTLQTNIVGQPGTATFTDTNALGPGPFFYRVGVGN